MKRIVQSTKTACPNCKNESNYSLGRIRDDFWGFQCEKCKHECQFDETLKIPYSYEREDELLFEVYLEGSSRHYFSESKDRQEVLDTCLAIQFTLNQIKMIGKWSF